MPPINIPIKPASSAQQHGASIALQGRKAGHTEQEFEGMLQSNQSEKRQAGMNMPAHICLVFQGGDNACRPDFTVSGVVLQSSMPNRGVEIQCYTDQRLHH